MSKIVAIIERGCSGRRSETEVTSTYENKGVDYYLNNPYRWRFTGVPGLEHLFLDSNTGELTNNCAFPATVEIITKLVKDGVQIWPRRF